MALKLTKGALVWVKHPKEAWVPATVSEVLSEDKLRVFYGNGSSNNVKIQLDNPILRTIGCPGDVELSGMSDMEDLFSDDLTKMTQLITPAVLYTLHKEYMKGQFYSKLGSGTVLALNPFKEVPDLFTVKAIQTYHSVTLSELQNLPAHVYAAAQSALVRLRASVGKVNQSIIVSGESGAGKTWTVCCLMRYLAEVGIEQRHCLSSTDHDQSPTKSAYSTPRTSREQPSNITCKISPVKSQPDLRNGFVENVSEAKRNMILGDGQLNEENNNFNNNICSEKNMLFPEEMAAGDNVSVSSYKTAENSLGDSYEDFDETLNFNSTQGSVFPSLIDSLDSENFDNDDSDVDLNVSLEIVDRIERRILLSNPILEAFGNACTLRNENSSRFGKYIQLQYDRSGTIVGAQLRTYLLEKTRSVRHDAGERSYHIFYQMLNGANEEQRSSWKLPDIAFPQESVNEKHSAKEQLRYSYDFKETRSSMLKIGINYKMQDNIFKVLSSLLYLRSLTFEGTDDLITPCTLDSTDASIENNLRIASGLLGVHQRLVMEAITFREITAHSNRRKSVFHRPSTVEECKSRRDSLVKFAYDLLFHWIVDRVGESVSAPTGKWCSFIGLLDVYGFESFDHNSLEQLCINYANEKLQQHFVASFLREQQEEYLLEGVTWQHCDLTDNVECLNSLELPRNSLFSLLNEECRLNRANARSGLKSRVESMFHGSKFILQPRISTAEPSFSVVHYAGHVNYQTRDLIEKNKDEVPPEIIQLLASSQNEFVHDLVASTQEENISPNKAKQRQTVLTRFKESLDDLLETLASTDCHYIRCIKPNKLCQPGVFDSKFVLDQLQACGVVETIRICSPAHPNKISYSEFTARYRFLLRKEAIIIPQVNLESEPATPSRKKRRCLTNIDMRKEACSRIVRILMERDETNAAVTKETKEPLQFGKTKVFLSAQLFESLESARSQEIDKCTVTIQQGWRQFAHIRRCREERKRMIAEREKSSGLLQRVWRNIIAVRKSRIERHVIIEQRQKSATKIQKCWRLYKRRQQARKERKMMIAKQNNAATTIQSGQTSGRIRQIDRGFRGWRVRCKYRDLMEAWMKLKLIPEEEYRKMIERQLRNLLPPCVISMPSPSYEAIKSSFEIPKIGKTSTPKRHSENDSGVHTLSSSTKSFNKYPDEKFSVYYDSRVSRSVALQESIIHDDLDPDEEFDLQTFGKLRISAKRSSPNSKDSDSDVEPPLRSSGGIRHAKIVRSSGSLNRSKVATSMIKELERSRSMPRLVRGPGVIYAWHNRATISMMTPKRPLSLSSDPLTLLEMQYNRSSSVLTTPFPNLRLSKKHSRNRHRRSRHQQSPQNLSYSDHNLSSSGFNRFSPSRSAMNTCSLNQFRAMSRSGSNCILKHADVKPKFI